MHLIELVYVPPDYLLCGGLKTFLRKFFWIYVVVLPSPKKLKHWFIVPMYIIICCTNVCKCLNVKCAYVMELCTSVPSDIHMYIM